MVAQVEILREFGGLPIVLASRNAWLEEHEWRFGDAEILLSPAQSTDDTACAALLDQAGLDVLHLIGPGAGPGEVVARWASGAGIPLIVSPNEALDPYITARTSPLRQFARPVEQTDAAGPPVILHALSQENAKAIAGICPGAHIEIVPFAAADVGADRKNLPPPNFLYLGSVHENKNIAELVSAFLSVRNRLPDDATLTIAGWGTPEELHQLDRAVGPIDPAVQFVGVAFAGHKAALLDVSRFFVLPSLGEGMPVEVLESWASGIPAVLSDRCNLASGFDAGAALRCGTDGTSIGEALVEALRIGEDHWMAMSSNAQNLAATTFSHRSVSDRWGEVYSASINRLQ